MATTRARRSRLYVGRFCVFPEKPELLPEGMVGAYVLAFATAGSKVAFRERVCIDGVKGDMQLFVGHYWI